MVSYPRAPSSSDMKNGTWPASCGLPWGRGGDPPLSVLPGWPNIWEHHQWTVDTDPTLPGGKQAQTFDLTLPAPRAGLLLCSSKNNLYSTWETKWLIKWKQAPLSSSKGCSFKWCICIFNEAEMLGSWDFRHLKTNTFERTKVPEGTRNVCF